MIYEGYNKGTYEEKEGYRLRMKAETAGMLPIIKDSLLYKALEARQRLNFQSRFAHKTVQVHVLYHNLYELIDFISLLSFFELKCEISLVGRPLVQNGYPIA